MKEFDNKQDYLLDMLSYYVTDTDRRAVEYTKESTNCSYLPTKTSDGCAIGRYAIEEYKRTMELVGTIKTIYHNNRELYEKALPTWMKDFGISFLDAVQALHDVPSNWNVNSLSMKGKEDLSEIITYYELDKDKFLNYL